LIKSPPCLTGSYITPFLIIITTTTTT
jgi:hypothetical protein